MLKACSRAVTSFLIILGVSCLFSALQAARFTITVRNEINDKEDPIRLKSVNVSIGKIEDISHQKGDPIGKEFKVTLNMPAIEPTAIDSYLESLKVANKQLDSFFLGNETRGFSFEAFLTGVGTTRNPQAKNLSYHFLPSNKGFSLSEF